MRQHLNKIDTIDQIILASKHPKGKNYIWILVEGISDHKLYKKLINGSNTKVEQVNGGGINELKQALTQLIQKNICVIGIRDADFMHLDQQQEDIDVLFLTDVHDAEMLLIACDVVFEHLLNEYLPIKPSNTNNFRDDLLRSLVFISGLRWLNHIDDIGLNFKGISVDKFYDASLLKLDKHNCMTDVIQRSPKKKREPDITEIEEKISTITDYNNLSNGHDVLKALALHITSKNNKGVNHDDLAEILRIAYRFDDFTKTNLYNNLKQWEQSADVVLFA